VPSFVGYKRVVKGEKVGVTVTLKMFHTALGVPPKFSEGTAELEAGRTCCCEDSEPGRPLHYGRLTPPAADWFRADLVVSSLRRERGPSHAHGGLLEAATKES